MIPSRLATKDEILLVHSNNFYDSLESTKTASKKDLKNREGTLRSIEYTNVIEFSIFRLKNYYLIN